MAPSRLLALTRLRISRSIQTEAFLLITNYGDPLVDCCYSQRGRRVGRDQSSWGHQFYEPIANPIGWPGRGDNELYSDALRGTRGWFIPRRSSRCRHGALWRLLMGCDAGQVVVPPRYTDPVRSRHMTNPFLVMLSQIGAKDARKRTRDELIEASDLPGEGWKTLGTTSRRIGVAGRRDELEIRARRAGCCIAARSFEQGSGLWGAQAHVSTYASVDDAELVVADMPARLRPNPRAEVRPTGGQEIGGIAVPGLERVSAYEDTSISAAGTGASRYIAGNIDEVVFIFGCGGRASALPWDQLISIAEVQADRIRRYRG
jgi:hypothetical protein